MPELPEVETFVRKLQPIVGCLIQRIDVLDDRLNLDGTTLVGATVGSVERRGKHIVIGLGNRGDLVVHLRMSGRLRTTRSDAEIKHTRLALHLDSGEIVYFVNPRRLGTALHCPSGFTTHLGHEPLSPSFTTSVLAELAAQSSSPIKTFLLDQQKIAGIGNIYASEALWRSGIAPERAARTLTQDEIRRLHRDIVSVLNDAIDGQGTTLGNSVSDYHPSVGEQGEFQNHLSVYGRESKPCERCGTAIARLKQGGRSTYYCSQCQT
ncbi:bifunctional DNA-formamidopyrimidine glycosylase/DNA-(apurinic or apyrimidinic site) lyase [Candidatus Bipolaricaulota bacterium]|nr:bifunctional DNA-formamidopyrimidine glycosylase/DNA-(apurinic or apyrimidinic site) lyase [Candidatus Bipolaricaulota bacterium]